MKEVWDRIETWLKGHAPEVLRSLRVGATQKELESAESALGVELPHEVEKSFLIHDGQDVDSVDGSVFGLIDGYQFLPLRSLLEVWESWKKLLEAGTFQGVHSEPDERIRPHWWNVSWIPIADNGLGDNYCVDLDPAPTGSLGQIIAVCHDHPSRSVLAADYRKWLMDFVEKLESGSYVFSKEFGGIMKRDDV